MNPSPRTDGASPATMTLARRVKRLRRSFRQWRDRTVPLARAVARGATHIRRPRPRVSAVVVARNDGYFPDYAARIHATVEWNHARLADEVILVEWNPPPDRPLFATGLAAEFPFLKAYVVAPALHQAYAPPPHLVILDYMAKNVGIRRATGDYICASNIDIFFEPRAAFIRFMLDPAFVFRTSRVDFHWDGKPMRPGILRGESPDLPGFDGWRSCFFHGSGDFTLAHRDLWYRARGYDESIPLQRMHADSRGLLQLGACGGKIVLWGCHYHTFHASASTAAGNPTLGGPIEIGAGIPYTNSENWGLGNAVETQLSERVWTLT